LLYVKSQFSEAKLAAQSAYDSDPYLKDVDKTIWRLFQTSVSLGLKTEAEKWCSVGRQRVPENFRFTECQLWLYSMQGQKPAVDSIWSVYREYVRRSPTGRRQLDSLEGGMVVALGLVRAGLPDSARAVMARSRGNQQVDPASDLLEYEAKVRAQLGDKAEAIKALTRWYAANPQQRAFAKNDESWWYQSIRDEPSYKALVGSAP
jgi:hypothetical protein